MKNIQSIILLLLLCVLPYASVLAQKVSGIVIDQAFNEPIIGASVKIKGTNTGTVTDANGQFTINTSQTSGELEVIYLGYKNQIVPFQSGTPVKVLLAEDVQMLDQVVVIGYGVQKKSDLTGSVSSIKADEVIKMPTTNVTQALQGKASGVEVVQNSGAPGSSTSIRIRGMGTVNNSDPLYVVDGISMNNIDYLSSDEIESIEILKDAASAAIYGSRAANGVVLITTKSGIRSTKKLNVNFTGYMGSQEVWKEPDIMTKDQYIYFSDYVLDGYVKTAKADDGSLYVKPEFQGMLDNGNNWWDIVTRKAMMQKYNLAISGGDKELNYYLSGNYQKTDGIVDESEYDKKGFNLKINSQMLKNLNLSANLTYTNENNRVVNQGTWGIIKTAMDFNPLTPIYDINGSYTRGTPVENLRRTTYDSYKNNFIGQLKLDWSIIKDLTFGSRASYINFTSDRDNFNIYNINPEIVGNMRFDVSRNPRTIQNLGWDNILTYTKTFGEHDLSLMAGQTMEISSDEAITASGTGSGGYSDYFDSLSLAYSDQKNTGYTTGWSALSFLGRIIYSYKDKYLFQSNFRADGSSRFSKKNRWGYFPSASVGWKINAEQFMQDLTFLSLLKLRAGWGQLGNNRISNFEYLTMVGRTGGYIYGTGIPSLKNAMSIIQYGNENIRWERTESTSIGLDLNLFDNRFTSSFEYFTKKTDDMLIAVPIVYSAGFGSINEDYGTMRNLIPLQNAGSVQNKGFEIQASYRDKIGNVGFEVNGNISFIKNEVTSLGSSNEPILGGELAGPNPLGYVNKTVVGAPIGCFYGYKTAGILTPDDFANGKPIVPVFASSTPFQPGDMKFADVNRDGKIDENDQTFLGSPHPDFFYGFNVNLNFKGFDLQMFFQGVQGNKLYNVMKYFQYSCVNYDGTWNMNSVNYSNVATDYFDKVYRPVPNPASPTYRDNWGANPTGTVPAPSSDASRNALNFINSDFYIGDGSYLRLKNIQLGYNFSKNVCDKLKIKNLRIYASATNLFTITAYKGPDPEVGKKIGTEDNNLFIGIDEGNYPQARTYIAGLVFDF